MSGVKVNLLLVTLVSFTIGTVSNASAQQIRTASLDSSQLFADGSDTATKSTTRIEITGARRAVESIDPATPIQMVTSPAGSFSQANFQQPIQPLFNGAATAPLVTLGPTDNFANMVEQSSGVVLVDFYADWCGPCRRQGGILHEMENTARQSNASIIKVNVDQHRRLASAFGVTSMPTLVLIKDGEIVDRQTGVADHQRVASLLAR